MESKMIYLANDIEIIKTKILNFKIFIDGLFEGYTTKMQYLAEKEKSSQQVQLDILNNNSGTSSFQNNISITSDLWETVILITSGIQTSVKSTEDHYEFNSISPRDYTLRNKFEIFHP